MADIVRTYLVIGPQFDDSGVPFPSAAPAGSVVTHEVDGRRIRVLLTDTPLPGHGNVYVAEAQDGYL
ncbi:hypothetical protein ACWEGS_28815 [Streptomyces sp. NPDC004822]